MKLTVEIIGLSLLVDRLDAIDQRLAHLANTDQLIMATLQDIENSIESETTIVDGITVLIQHLADELKDALSGVNLPPEVQARVDAAFALNEENKQRLADALLANTPEELANTAEE